MPFHPLLGIYQVMKTETQRREQFDHLITISIVPKKISSGGTISCKTATPA